MNVDEVGNGNENTYNILQDSFIVLRVKFQNPKQINDLNIFLFPFDRWYILGFKGAELDKTA